MDFRVYYHRGGGSRTTALGVVLPETLMVHTIDTPNMFAFDLTMERNIWHPHNCVNE